MIPLRFVQFFCFALLFVSPLQQASAQRIVSVGSNTMQEVLEELSAAFQEKQPDVEFSIEAKGSGTAPIALMEGRSQIAPMSRKMTREEIKTYEEKTGVKPLEVRIALDALAIYVHKDNPIKGLTLDQLDAIFSSTLSCSKGLFAESEMIVDWSEVAFSTLGKITVIGRNQESGTYDYFREQALCGGNFRADITAVPDSKSVLDWVAQDSSAIGYAGIGFRSDEVRTVALSKKPQLFGAPYHNYIVDKYKDDANLEKRYGWVVRGKYPLSRYLYLYIHGGKLSAVDLKIKAFIEFTLSEQGQRIVHQAGYIPLPKKELNKERQRINKLD